MKWGNVESILAVELHPLPLPRFLSLLLSQIDVGEKKRYINKNQDLMDFRWDPDGILMKLLIES